MLKSTVVPQLITSVPYQKKITKLSQILETGPVDPKYTLSKKACSGILNRAERRGKKLPEMLETALEKVVSDNT